MAIATGSTVKLFTGGRSVVVTGQVGSVVSYQTLDGAMTGSYEESLIRPPRVDGESIITGRNKVGLY